MSGVAATLINGETVHSAAHLNCKKITVEHQREWANARMIIVDEISFASSSDILNLHEKLTQPTKRTRRSKVRWTSCHFHRRLFSAGTR
jgi:ATP:corrinoid adenosyltransferase